jgi:hypothetical protein
MKRAASALVVALLLGACVFSSETAFFAEDEALAPFADGARYIWIENGSEETRQVVSYRRAGGAYEIGWEDEDDRLHALFIGVPETAEEDYIVQVRIDEGERATAYAFMWRTQAGYRAITSPRVFEPGSEGEAVADRLCERVGMGECRFASAEAVREFYHTAVYPAFVLGGQTPANYIDQLTPPPV